MLDQCRFTYLKIQTWSWCQGASRTDFMVLVSVLLRSLGLDFSVEQMLGPYS